MLNKVKPRVSPYMNEALLAPYTEEEVKCALFSTGDLKAPGPDGLHAIFYNKKLASCRAGFGEGGTGSNQYRGHTRGVEHDHYCPNPKGGNSEEGLSVQIYKPM